MKVELSTRDGVRECERQSSEKKRMTEIWRDRAVKDRLDEQWKARSREVVHFVG